MSTRLVAKTENPEWLRQGATLRAFREMRGLTADQLANKLGCARSHISNIEGGRRPMTARMVPLAADVLGVPQIALVRPGEFDEPAA